MLGIGPSFDVDLPSLEKTHRELSRALHPDKFVQAGASERRSALERAADVNEAWRRFSMDNGATQTRAAWARTT